MQVEGKGSGKVEKKIGGGCGQGGGILEAEWEWGSQWGVWL